MSDIRITGGVPAPLPAQHTEAVRSAQRAFFQAALNEVQAAPAARPVETQSAPQTRSTPGLPSTASPESGRYARPGSLLDIKV